MVNFGLKLSCRLVMKGGAQVQERRLIGGTERLPVHHLERQLGLRQLEHQMSARSSSKFNVFPSNRGPF